MNYGYLFTEKLGTHFSWIRGNTIWGEGDKCETDQHGMWKTLENNSAHKIFTQKRCENIYKADKYLLTSAEICGLLVTCLLKPG